MFTATVDGIAVDRIALELNRTFAITVMCRNGAEARRRAEQQFRAQLRRWTELYGRADWVVHTSLSRGKQFIGGETRRCTLLRGEHVSAIHHGW